MLLDTENTQFKGGLLGEAGARAREALLAEYQKPQQRRIIDTVAMLTVIGAQGMSVVIDPRSKENYSIIESINPARAVTLTPAASLEAASLLGKCAADLQLEKLKYDGLVVQSLQRYREKRKTKITVPSFLTRDQQIAYTQILQMQKGLNHGLLRILEKSVGGQVYALDSKILDLGYTNAAEALTQYRGMVARQFRPSDFLESEPISYAAKTMYGVDNLKLRTMCLKILENYPKVPNQELYAHHVGKYMLKREQ